MAPPSRETLYRFKLGRIIEHANIPKREGHQGREIRIAVRERFASKGERHINFLAIPTLSDQDRL
jgi:hypothetical protein